MNAIWLWAPRASRVELVTSDRRLPMTSDAPGEFRTPVLLAPGTDYGFSLDGGEPLPDPRSRWQPRGVHQLSRVPPTEFPWTDAAFRPTPLAAGVIYELHVGTFAEEGTFDGVIARLDHLVELGVTHVELMPIAEFAGAYGWGYDGVSLYAPHSRYGGPLALKRLVDACHARGLTVLLDVVYNHLGPEGNYLALFGPYFDESNHTPWGAAVNLDGPDADPVRAFLIDNALYWLEEYHVDGLRLDAVHALSDRSARHFLQELGEQVSRLSSKLGKTLCLTAESDLNDPRHVRSAEAGGFGLDAQWSDDFHHALHAVLTGERQGYYADFGGLETLAHAVQRGFVYEGQFSAYRRRRHGAPLGDVPLSRLINYMQNHDQVGNRACGERLGHLVPVRRLKLGAALVLLGPSVPLLFQGEEWNASARFCYFADFGDRELRSAVRQGRLREFTAFGWSEEGLPDPLARETFESCRLDFAERERPDHAAVLAFYRALLALRRERLELRSASVRVRHDEAAGYLVVERESASLLVNFSPETLRIPACARAASAHELLYESEGARLDGEHVLLPPESLAVVSFALRRGVHEQE